MSKTIYSAQIVVSCPLVYDDGGYYHLIYKTTNLKNGKIYIGKHSTKDPYDSYLGSGKRVISAIKKYGIENFTKELLFCFTDEKEAYLKEEEIVTQEFVDRNDTYNVITGGYGFRSEDIKGKKHPMYGKKRKFKQESKDKMSKSRKGKKLTQETKDKLSKANKGKKLAQEAKDKISKNHADFSDENHPQAKRILKIDASGNIVTEYGCKKDCCAQEHIYYKKLSKIIKEHILHNGFYFEYKSKN